MRELIEELHDASETMWDAFGRGQGFWTMAYRIGIACAFVAVVRLVL